MPSSRYGDLNEDVQHSQGGWKMTNNRRGGKVVPVWGYTTVSQTERISPMPNKKWYLPCTTFQSLQKNHEPGERTSETEGPLLQSILEGLTGVFGLQWKETSSGRLENGTGLTILR